MTFEVVARVFGILSTGDLKEVAPDAQDVFAVVLHAAAPPFAGTVEFGTIPGGHARHRGLRCARCSAVKYKLFYNGRELACARCSRRRSRRQTERTCGSWKKYNGELEDRLLRALRPGRRSSSVLPAIGQLAKKLVEGDQEHWHLIQQRVQAAMTMAVMPPISAADVLKEFAR